MPVILSVLAALTILAVAMVATPRPAWAHHGTAQYDFSGDVILNGVVADYTFESPHIWLKLKAPGPDGRTAEWTLEGPPPVYAVNRGWARDSLRPGQPVTVAMAPHRRAAHAGLIISVAGADGRVFLERGRRY